MGQHVAAALEIPELVIFNGYPTEKFSRKWHPYGSGKIKIIHAEGKSEKDVLEITKRVLNGCLFGAGIGLSILWLIGINI